MSAEDFVLDTRRHQRLRLSEAVFCAGKSSAQIAAIIDHVAARGLSLLLTRLDEARWADLPPRQRDALDYDPVSRTAIWGQPHPCGPETNVAIVTAGTSDVPVAREAARTLRFEGFGSEEIVDVGVAGLWRLLRRVEELQRFPVVIVAAGMDAALPSVVGGLVGGLVIAVPTSVGYGVAAGGHTALNAILASCAPGIVTVNIDNGYGAACAAIRALGGRTAKGEGHADGAS
jgi:pyridinium-3,5-biscarboxylic acid mononucleotide synthase